MTFHSSGKTTAKKIDAKARRAARSVHGLSKYDTLVRESVAGRTEPDVPLPQVFGRIGHRNPLTGMEADGTPFSAAKVIAGFTDALDAMRDDSDPASDVDAGMTFFGQFIDHDVTLDAQSAIGTRIDPRSIRNVRTPALDLDCVYGDGPEASPHLYSPRHEGFLNFGTKANPRDLARNAHGTALIGDPRNDENQIVSQLQGAFVTLHNIVMTAIEAGEADVPAALSGIRSEALAADADAGAMAFQAARRIVRLHYQWLIMNDFLPAFVDAKVLHSVKHALASGHLPAPFKTDSPVMPIEFSGAAYRFGHATVQNDYTLNTGAGRKFNLFELGRPEFSSRKPELNIDWECLFRFPGGADPDTARPIGRKLPGSIFILPFINHGLSIDGEELAVEEARKLPHRNVFRDRFALELASGQQMARKMGVAELRAPEELRKSGITKTPLWYYCLHEAERCGGKLGPVGGTIVATTLLRLLYLDPESIVNTAPDFTPWASLGAEDGKYSMGHMLKCVQDKRASIAVAEDLITG
ncbi:MAG: hypothetical protein NXH97_02670 [Rhodobacteraceae bacterium]|nr:hypothetical protein [Paracoccaceae bacterium]